VIVANAASVVERMLLERLPNDIGATASLNILHVPLETLHASWNRGINAAQSQALGFWNVDDTRTVTALLEGYVLIAGKGYELVDFPARYQVTQQRLGVSYTTTHIEPPQYKPAPIHPRNVTGPFFMFSKTLFEKAGDFDEGFPIVGDFDWCMREAVRTAKIGYGTQIAGDFYLHGDNITQASGMSDWVGFNVALLRHGAYDALRPVDPVSMKEAWHTWGNNGVEIPDDVQLWLWGAGAEERFKRYQWERNLPQPARRIFLSLAKRGVLHSVDWDLHHG